MVVSKRLSPRPIFALYDMHEMSRPQLMKALMNVMTSQYMKALTKEYVNITPVTTTNGLPEESVVLVYSSTFAKSLIGNGKFSDYNGSVYHRGSITYIIGLSLNFIRCLLIQSPKDDAQEKTVIKGYYFCAFNIFKAWRFARGDFDADHHYGFYYTLINEPEEWDAVRQTIERDSANIFGISFDIETAGFPKFISAFGFTIMSGTLDKPVFKSYCISMGVHTYSWHLNAMRYLCQHPAPKIAHNGAYDCTVLLRYRIPVTNMLYDTMLMAHSLICDAPKRLNHCASYYLPDYVYWKSEITGKENNLNNEETENEAEDKHGVPATQEGRLVYYKYCAKDTYYTACICLEMLMLFREKPWAVKNYCLVHFLQYRVGIFMGLAGMPIDKTKFNAWVEQVVKTKDALLSDLRSYAKDELFNPGSTAEVQNYIYGTLGLPLPRGIRLKKPSERKKKAEPVKPMKIQAVNLDDLDLFDTASLSSTSAATRDFSLYPTDKTAIRFLIDQNPDYEKQLKALLDYRWYTKVISNYLMSTSLLCNSTTDKNVGVLLYNPSIAKTVTCRYGGGKSNLDWGAYHLNLPPGLWGCIKVPAGHVRYSIDYSHSDDYFVAFYSGVPAMMENVVRTDLDLHMKHASLIFQRPYDYLMEHKKDKTSEAPLLRKLTKSIGHGCKYLMGGYTMYTHMGDPNICAAIDALHADVDKHSLAEKVDFASYLQSLFYKQYEGLTQWHKDVFTKLMTNPERTITVGNWTRQILSPAGWFSVHSGSVAQYGQAGTSSNSNAFLRKFFRKPLDPSSYIFAQVHDAMDGFARNEDEVKAVAKMMEEPITVTDIYGTTRTFSVATEAELFWPDEKSS